MPKNGIAPQCLDKTEFSVALSASQTAWLSAKGISFRVKWLTPQQPVWIFSRRGGQWVQVYFGYAWTDASRVAWELRPPHTIEHCKNNNHPAGGIFTHSHATLRQALINLANGDAFKA